MGWAERWLTEPAALDAVAGEWARLAGDAPPWERPAWFRSWWECFGSGGLAVHTLWDGGELAAVIPLAREGRRLGAVSNTHSPAFRPISRDADALARAATSVMRAAPCVHLHELPEGEDAAALQRAARQEGRLVLAEHQYDAPVTDTTGEFAAYRERMRRGWTEIERRGRKLRREHAVELTAISGEANAGLEEGLRLEAAGWKGREGTAILASPSTAAFYRTVAAAAELDGTLRCSALRVDGRLAGFDLAMVADGRYLLLKTAYDETMRSLSPGLVLRRAVVERCFELGLHAHEFLGQDAAWKRLFATGARPHMTLRAYAARPAPAAAYAYRRVLRPPLARLKRRWTAAS